MAPADANANELEKVQLEKVQAQLLRAEQALRAALKEKDVLLKEVHHRVKNNLQVICSLLNLQASRVADQATRDILTESQSRVLAIALVHENLYQSARLSHVNFNDYISALLANLLHGYNADERGIAHSVDVGGGQLPINVAIPCGLIVNELVSNTLKHAYPPGRRGMLVVALTPQEGGALELLVGDDGIGLPGDLDPRRTPSLGLDLVFTFADQLNAQVEICREGGTWFRFKLGVVEA